VITFTSKGVKLLQKIKPVWDALQQAMEELVNENEQSKKILEALTAMEKSIQKTGVFHRVEKILK